MNPRILAVVSFLILSVASWAQPSGPGVPGGPGGRPRPGGPGQPRFPDNPDAQLLRQCADNFIQSRFVGTRVTIVRLGDHDETTTEFVRKDGPNFRIEYPTGSLNAGEIVVIRNRSREHYFPQSNEIQVSPFRVETLLHQMVGMIGGANGLKISGSAGQPICGLPTRKINLVDNRSNIVASFWVNPQNKLFLKRELYDPSGRLVGSYEYTKLDLTPNFAEDDFRIVRRGAIRVTIADKVRALAKQAGVAPRILAPQSGFELESARLIKAGGVTLVQESYTSPHARISVFLTRAEVDDRRLSRLAGGNLNVYRLQFGPEQAVFVGPLPGNQLREIAQSLNLVPI